MSEDIQLASIPPRGRHRRHVANLLSLGNLCCGLGAVAMAAAGRLDVTLVLVLLGCALDGLDGLAARRGGGTPFGVLADDIADAITYGLAPGAAVFFTVGAAEGLIVGAAYALFTWTRLLYFTLTKGSAEAGCFGGVPSAIGAVLVVSTLLVLGDHALYVGAGVGVACALMVAFPVRYLHGSKLLRKPIVRAGLGVAALLVAVVVLLAGVQGLAALLLGGALAYGFWPSARALSAALKPAV